MSTENDSTYIKVPKSVVQIGAIAIIIRSISIIGWSCIEYITVDTIWQNRKHAPRN